MDVGVNPRRAAAWAGATLLVLDTTTACGDDSSGEGATTLTVYAAASLTKPFEAIGAELGRVRSIPAKRTAA